jgi:oligopeptide/dipeptide ABC transporter ATP-binding protein
MTTLPDDLLLRVSKLSVGFLNSGEHRAVTHGVDLEVRAGECRAVVGESGSGKSVTALAILGLLPRSTSRILFGCATFKGQNLLAQDHKLARTLRGDRLAMVFQDPLSSLNPYRTVGSQIQEAFRETTNTRSARKSTEDLLAEVELPDPSLCFDAYPHQLSGGQRQRVLIAMALTNAPDLLIADEPTTALDVTVQSQILALFRRLQERRRMALLLITHDLGVVAGLADRVSVMYAGRIVEEASAADLFESPQHPYTKGLLRALPERQAVGEALHAIPGQPPDPMALTPGCAFAPRCESAIAACSEVGPRVFEGSNGRSWSCRTFDLQETAYAP